MKIEIVIDEIQYSNKTNLKLQLEPEYKNHGKVRLTIMDSESKRSQSIEVYIQDIHSALAKISL
jgi:hypothetical protein